MVWGSGFCQEKIGFLPLLKYICYVEDKIIELLVSFLGDYSKQCGEWYSFNCPCCAEENFGEPDNKYNLEVKIDLDINGCGGFHCWKCGDTNGMRGTLVSLFKKYTNSETYNSFKNTVSEHRASSYYRISSDESLGDDITDIEYLSLPDGFKPIDKTSADCKDAYDYLVGRGITDEIIHNFNIGYISTNSKDYSLRKRVYIPSYDRFDNLTYWVGRDYTGKNKQKVKNPKRSKMEIVFNEGKINWYEPVTLVEGPFDHIVTPNSIPLMGKTLSEDYAVFTALVDKCRCGVNIFLDDDAIESAYKIYKLLNSTVLKGQVKIILSPIGYDPSLLYQHYSRSGIIKALKNAQAPDEYDVLWKNKFGVYNKK